MEMGAVFVRGWGLLVRKVPYGIGRCGRWPEAEICLSMMCRVAEGG